METLLNIFSNVEILKSENLIKEVHFFFLFSGHLCPQLTIKIYIQFISFGISIMTWASFCGLLYAAAGMFKTRLTYCQQDRKQSYRCFPEEAGAGRKGLTLSLSLSVPVCWVSLKSAAWPFEWGRGTTHCARVRANTHSLVQIMRNCYKSTSCFQNCWFFIILSYSYQAMKSATSQIWSHSFPSVLLHTQAKKKAHLWE